MSGDGKGAHKPACEVYCGALCDCGCHEPRRPSVTRLTPDQIAAKLRDLRRDLTTWEGLRDQWRSLDGLRHEVATYEWLAGGATSEPYRGES